MCSTTTPGQAEVRLEASLCLGRPLTEQEWEQALPRAERKLRWILDREGSANDLRLSPWYLGKLVEEALGEAQLTSHSQKHSAKARCIKTRRTQTNRAKARCMHHNQPN